MALDDPNAASSAAPTAADPDTLLASASPEGIEKWRNSGDLADLGATLDPAHKPADQPADAAPATPDRPAASTDASSKPASETGDPKDKKGKGVKARIGEIDAEITELNEKLRQRALLRQQVNQPDPAPAAPAPAAKPSAATTPTAADDPEPDETDATKYPDGVYDPKWQKDHHRWAAREEIRVREAHYGEQAKTARLQDLEHETLRQFSERAAQARVKHPDWDEKVQYSPTEIVKDSPVDRYVMEAEDGALVAYYLQTTPGETRRINALPVLAQLRELARIGLDLTKDEAEIEPARIISRAPDPASTLGDRPSAPSDDVARALAAGDEAAYIAAANARDAASMRLSR